MQQTRRKGSRGVDEVLTVVQNDEGTPVRQETFEPCRVVDAEGTRSSGLDVRWIDQRRELDEPTVDWIRRARATNRLHRQP